jgi:predicted dehydrogenase
VSELLRARTPDPADAPALRWGVVGTGWIAERFIASAQRHTRQHFQAVASRDPDRARPFAEAHGIPDVVDLDGLAAHPGVDVVYVASPHPFHAEHALTAIRAGKHVLVEKPIALDAEEARTLAEAARAAGVFCAEALWTFFLPRWDVVAQVLERGDIGELRSVLAEYGEYLPDDHRAMDPGLAGGSLLDLGTYPIATISRLLRAPTRVEALGTDNRFGVNEQTGLLVADGRGALGVGFTSLGSSTPTSATLAGTRGAIELPGPFYQPGPVIVRTWADGVVAAFDEPAIGHDGLHYEAAATARAIAAGLTEAPERPLDESIAFLELLDAVRERIGVDFGAARAG